MILFLIIYNLSVAFPKPSMFHYHYGTSCLSCKMVSCIKLSYVQRWTEFYMAKREENVFPIANLFQGILDKHFLV